MLTLLVTVIRSILTWSVLHAVGKLNSKCPSSLVEYELGFPPSESSQWNTILDNVDMAH